MKFQTFFSGTEVVQIVISVLVLVAVFSYPEFLANPYFLLTSLAVLGVAFMGHELAHKFVSIREGYWSEYRMWPQGLMLAVLMAFASGGSLIFAAPGAVYFSSRPFQTGPGKKGLLKISMAGIAFNITLMWISLAGYFLTGFSLLSYMALINAWLALFNLIPFGMLDGQKIFRLNRDVWIVLLVLAGIGFVLSQF